jgi:hypothetical protein
MSQADNKSTTTTPAIRPVIGREQVLDNGTVAVYCDTLIAAEERGPVTHLVLAASQGAQWHDDQPTEYVVQVRVIIPTEKVSAFAQFLIDGPDDLRRTPILRVVN